MGEMLMSHFTQAALMEAAVHLSHTLTVCVCQSRYEEFTVQCSAPLSVNKQVALSAPVTE